MEKSPISFEGAMTAFDRLRNMVANLHEDEALSDMFDSFLKACFDYAKSRAEWSLLDRESKIKIDEERTCFHNLVINRLSIVLKLIKQDGGDTDWLDSLSDDGAFVANRKLVGDFACYITCILGIASR